MTRYVSLAQAVLDFRVSAKKLVELTADGGEFPLCKWAGTLYFDSTELEKKFRWRKSRSPHRPDSVNYPRCNRCMKTETSI